MSIPVSPAALSAHLEGREFAYLVTNSQSRSHVVALVPRVSSGAIVFERTGRTSRHDIETNRNVTVVWPPSSQPGEHSDYTLIADGRGEVRGESVVVAIDSAVLHRAARSST